MAKVIFNKISVESKLKNALAKKPFVGRATVNANTRFVIAKQTAYEDFDEHPITKEIEDEFGKSEYIGRGNLFSFLGFFRGSKPIETLRTFFRSGFSMDRNPTVKKIKNGVVYSYKVSAPDLNQIYKQTPMPDNWSTKSWVQAIEEGIGTFASYIWHSLAFRSVKASRSGQALQVDNDKYTEDGVLGVSYLSGILKKFQSKFSSK